jgi:protocatechuate 3,4-dioxygenase beta subunit
MALVAIASTLAAGLGAERALAWSVQSVVAEASSTAPSASTPAKASWRAVLADADEPGEPLEVSGVVYEGDGKTPAAGTRIFVYHADASGHYSEGGQNREEPRLSAELVTGPDGKYFFRTIVPGYYPGGGTPRHIHYEITAKDGRTTSAEMRFADDPKLPKSTLDRAREAIGRGDRFFDVRPVERGMGGIKHCAFDLKLPPRPARAPRASG